MKEGLQFKASLGYRVSSMETWKDRVLKFKSP